MLAACVDQQRTWLESRVCWACRAGLPPGQRKGRIACAWLAEVYEGPTMCHVPAEGLLIRGFM